MSTPAPECSTTARFAAGGMPGWTRCASRTCSGHDYKMGKSINSSGGTARMDLIHLMRGVRH